MSKPHDEWFRRAEDDLKFAAVGLKEGFCTQVCFLSQQVIEKSLKGALVALGRRYPKSHNLRQLAKLLPELHLKKWQEGLTILDGYYVPLRYPDAAPAIKASGDPNESEAKQALSIAQEIFDTIQSSLNNFVRGPLLNRRLNFL